MADQPAFQPPASPPARSTNKTVLIVVVAAIALCCVCTAVVAGGGAIYYAMNQSSQTDIFTDFVPTIESQVVPALSTPVAVNTESPAVQPTQPPAVQPTQPPPAPTKPPAVQPTKAAEPSGDGLSVSRAEMMEYLGADDAFVFGQPESYQGLEIVQGTHTWICLKGDCAAVSLGGPAENLMVVAVVAPTDPADNIQTLTSIALLMTAASRFTGDTGDIQLQMMDDIINAQNAGQSLEKAIEHNGYLFTESYDAATHNAGILISRP